MGKTAILAIRIIGDSTDAVTSMGNVERGATSMQNTMDKASGAAVLALGGLTAAAVAAGNAASELEQATGAVDSVFGSYAGAVHEYAQTAAQDVGLAKSEYENMSAILGAQLKNMGVDMGDVGGQTKELIGLGADLAATFGGSTSDAVSALSSLLRGERDPIERYGVSIKQVNIDQKKAEMGLADLTGEADTAATTQATLALLTQQTADAQGQFGREADTAAGQQQRANAMWEDASAKLGESLLPLMTEGSKIASDLAGWISENTEVVTLLAGSIGILAAGVLVINGGLKLFAAAQAIATAAQWASNAAWLASPITWIILAIVAAIGLVVAIVVLLIQHWDEVAKVAADVWGGVVGWVQEVGRWFGDVFDNIGRGWQFLVDMWQAGIDALTGWIRDLLGWWDRLFNQGTPSWVRDIAGVQSAGFAAPAFGLALDQPAMFAAPMGGHPFAASFAAPASVAALTPSDLGRNGGPSAPATVQQIEINFHGLVTDPRATAAEIRKILDDDDLRSGRRRPGMGTR